MRDGMKEEDAATWRDGEVGNDQLFLEWVRLSSSLY
jgi:hypothetical protein